MKWTRHLTEWTWSGCPAGLLAGSHLGLQAPALGGSLIIFLTALTSALSGTESCMLTSRWDELGEFKYLEKPTKSLCKLSQVAKVRRQRAKVFHAVKARLGAVHIFCQPILEI